MKFLFTGFDHAAKRIEGEFEAANFLEAKTYLRDRRIRPLRLVPKKNTTATAFSLAFQSGKPKLMQFVAFIRQLAAMQGAGIPIVTALSVLADQQDNKQFGKVLSDVQRRIEVGTNLTDALAKHPDVFDKIFVNLIAAGEMSGALDKILNRLAAYYEKSAKLRGKIISAATYPTLIIVLVCVVVSVLMIFVVPTFARMFSGQGAELPQATQVIMNLSTFMVTYWYLVFGGFAGVIGGVYFLLTNDGARKVLDPYFLYIPLFGDLIRKVAIARFSRTLATMIQAGVAITEALDITAKTSGNYAIEKVINGVKASITKGESISAPLQRTTVFPKMAVSMIAIGEQVGSIDTMLEKVAEFYEDEVDAAVTALTSILEPLMIVIVGLVVAGVLIPMYLPIFKMADTIK
jgi:type IV pilus assembly protein PilC